MVQLIDCETIANEILEEVRAEVQTLPSQPHLAVILVGEDPASKVYVRNKEKRCESVGINSTTITLPDTVSVEEIKNTIEQLNAREDINGILLQLPLPKHLASYENELIQTIHHLKDVDGLTYENSARLLNNVEPRLDPCTPSGCLEVLKRTVGDLDGLDVAMVGRSRLVGFPLQMLLTHANATVTLCHSRTQALRLHTKMADVVITAIGRANYFDDSYFSSMTTIVDVGMNRDENGKLCGDVNRQSLLASELNKVQLTPVPRGIGQLTTTMLMVNTLKAYHIQQKKGD